MSLDTNTNTHFPTPGPEHANFLARLNRRGAALLALAASAVTATGIGVHMADRDASDPSTPFHLERPPAATAEPFDHASGVDQDSPVLLPSAPKAPANTQDTKSAPLASTTTTTLSSPNEAKSTQPEAKKPTLLDQANITSIAEKTGYKGLEGRALEIGEVIETKSATTQILKLDGAEQSVTTEQLRSYIEAAEKLAERQTAFTTTLQLGTGPATELTFETSSNDLNPKKDTHYVIFTKASQNLDELTAPVKGFAEASTQPLPYENLFVTLLSDTRGREWESLPANEYYALVEMIVARNRAVMNDASIAKIDSGTIDMSNLTETTLQKRKWEITRLGLDIFANSEASGYLHAKKGSPYARYAESVKQIPMRAFMKLKAFLYPVPEQRYYR